MSSHLDAQTSSATTDRRTDVLHVRGLHYASEKGVVERTLGRRVDAAPGDRGDHHGRIEHHRRVERAGAEAPAPTRGVARGRRPASVE